MKHFSSFTSISFILLFWGFFLTGYGQTLPVDTTKHQFDVQIIIPYLENGRYGYKDSLSGVVIDSAKYDRAYPLFNRMGMVKLHNKTGIIDLDNIGSIPVAYDTIVFPDTTFPYIKVNRNGKWGLYSGSALVLPTIYQEIRVFPKYELRDYACLVKTKNYWQIVKLINKQTFPVRFDSLVLDSTKLHAEPSFLSAASFKDNQYYPFMRNGKWGLINFGFGMSGKVLPPKFDSMPVFGFMDNSWHNGIFFIVKKDNKIGYFIENGQTLFPPVYDKIVPYKPDAAYYDAAFFIKIKGKWGLTNKNKSFIVPPKYDSVMPFNPCPVNSLPYQYFFVKGHNGWRIYDTHMDRYARIENSGSFTFDRIIDTLQCNYDYSEQKSYFYPIQKDGKWGLLETFFYNGLGFFFYEHLNPNYDSISLLYTDNKRTFFSVDSSDKVSIISRELQENNNADIESLWNSTAFMDEINMGATCNIALNHEPLYDEAKPDFYFRTKNKGKQGLLAQSCLCTLIPPDSAIDKIYVEYNKDAPTFWNLGKNGFNHLPVVSGKTTLEEYISYADSTVLFPNRIRVKDVSTDLYGVIDTNGREIVQPIYGFISPWKDSSLLVNKQFHFMHNVAGVDDTKSIFEVLEEKGILISNSTTSELDNSSSIQKLGIMDLDGKMTGPFIFDYVRESDHTKILGRGYDSADFLRGEKYDFPWNDVVEFNGEAALVHINDKWGMIDRTGKQILQPVYDMISYFDDPNDIGFSHSVVIPDSAEDIINYIDLSNDTGYWRSFVITVKAKKQELFTCSGAKVIPVSFDKIDVLRGSNLAVVTSNGKQGIFTNEGVERIPLIYDRIDVNEDSVTFDETNTFSVWMNGQHGLLDQNGVILIPFK